MPQHVPFPTRAIFLIHPQGPLTMVKALVPETVTMVFSTRMLAVTAPEATVALLNLLRTVILVFPASTFVTL